VIIARCLAVSPAVDAGTAAFTTDERHAQRQQNPSSHRTSEITHNTDAAAGNQAEENLGSAGVQRQRLAENTGLDNDGQVLPLD